MHAAPPTLPGNFQVEASSITSVFARIRWVNTNQTEDAGAERLVLLLTYSNMSLVQEVVLPGYATRVALDLIPGTEYVVRLRAENPDGMIITNPVSFTTLIGSEHSTSYFYNNNNIYTYVYMYPTLNYYKHMCVTMCIVYKLEEQP